MSRIRFVQELAALHDKLEEMATLSRDAISIAVESLEDLDHEKAKEVFGIDKKMFDLQIEVEQRCLDLIALQTPVARDLRRVGTAFKVVTDLDRIGRYATDIAEITLGFNEKAHLKRMVSIPHMADLTVAMVEKAVRALVTEDITIAQELDDDDEAVDALYDQIYREIVTYMMDGQLKIATGANYILVARYLERIADHAVNIGERVVFLVTGKRPSRGGPRPQAANGKAAPLKVGSPPLGPSAESTGAEEE
jgi:phosphate transport system protein